MYKYIMIIKYIYIYMCVCVCERERGMSKKKKKIVRNDEWREKVVSVINEGIEIYHFAK